jgi:hypothetical protein
MIASYHSNGDEKTRQFRQTERHIPLAGILNSVWRNGYSPAGPQTHPECGE